MTSSISVFEDAIQENNMYEIEVENQKKKIKLK